MMKSLFKTTTFLVISKVLFVSGEIGCTGSITNSQPGDTVILFEGVRVMIPLGIDTSCVLITTTHRNGLMDYIQRCNSDGRREKQVAIKHQGVLGIDGGEEMAKTYYKDLSEGNLYPPFKRIEAGVTDHGRYVILSQYDERFILWWFTPNGDHFIEVDYVLAKENFDELDGITELRRFAERVQLLSNGFQSL